MLKYTGYTYKEPLEIICLYTWIIKGADKITNDKQYATVYKIIINITILSHILNHQQLIYQSEEHVRLILL